MYYVCEVGQHFFTIVNKALLLYSFLLYLMNSLFEQLVNQVYITTLQVYLLVYRVSIIGWILVS